MVSKIELEKILEKCWGPDTSANPKNWTSGNKSLGQCAVTACVVQDYLGGDIIWALAVLPNGIKDSHYFNKIDGVEVDLTRKQFPEGTLIPEGIPRPEDFATTRAYILMSERSVDARTPQRYELLKSRVDEEIRENKLLQ